MMGASRPNPMTGASRCQRGNIRGYYELRAICVSSS